MGEMIPSYDNTKLYLNKETDMDCRAVAVIVHGLCEHQGRYDYFPGCSTRPESAPTALITAATDVPRESAPITRTLMNCWMTLTL